MKLCVLEQVPLPGDCCIQPVVEPAFHETRLSDSHAPAPAATDPEMTPVQSDDNNGETLM